MSRRGFFSAGGRISSAHALTPFFVGVLLLGIAVPAHSTVTYIQNAKIKIGVDLSKGGAITYLAPLRGNSNVVNSYDLGREIQQSYYSGPQPYDPYHTMSKTWKNWPWNPIQSGDVYGHPARVLLSHNDGKQIYVKTQPMQWALSKVPGEAVFETWITLDGIAARVHCRLTNQRTDTKAQFPWWQQEVPAVYTTGTLYRLMTYKGAHPFTGDKVTEMPRVGIPWESWRATENWAAMVNGSGWGLGVYQPGCGLYKGGFYGRAGSSASVNTGYIAPLYTDLLDYNIIYDYQYNLILGSLNDIRSWVYAHGADQRPDYQFVADRQHWLCPSGDGGFPLNGCLHVNLDSNDPSVFGPACSFRAEAVPRLYITAAYHVANPLPGALVGQLFWATNTGGEVNVGEYSELQSIQFDVIADDMYHTYTLDLASCPAYQGLITSLRLDPIFAGGEGDSVEIASITYRPPDATTSTPQSASK